MSKKIKVIELIPQIIDAGAETLVKDYVLHLSEDIFDITILTAYPLSVKSVNVRLLISNGKRIKSPFGISNETIFDKLFRKLRKLLIPQRVQDIYRKWYIQHNIRKIKPDVVHVHMHMLKYLPELSEDLRDAKVVYSCYSLPNRYFNDSNLKSEKDAANYLVAHNGLQFIAMHGEMRAELNKMFGVTNTLILRNAIDIANFRDVKIPKQTARQCIGIPDNAFVIGHVGRMFYIKNQLFLVDIFMNVLKRQPSAFLLLVGEGNDKMKIIEKLESNNLQGKYKILSNIDNLNVVYKAMDIFVFPSLLEGLPNVCIEAQVSGLPCVVSSAITKDVCISNNTVMVDLTHDIREWADIITSQNIIGKKVSDISEFEYKNVLKKLGYIYMGNEI